MTLLTGIFAVGGIIILIYMLKRRSFGFGILSALCGFFSLIAAYLVCQLLHTDIPVTTFSVSLGTIGGLPGVILLIALMTVFSQSA